MFPHLLWSAMHDIAIINHANTLPGLCVADGTRANLQHGSLVTVW
jgi:hypothetical protein